MFINIFSPTSSIIIEGLHPRLAGLKHISHYVPLHESICSNLYCHFLLKFMAVIHTAYATIKMPGPKGVITLKSDQRDALACDNAALTHVGCFGEKEERELAVKMAKMHEGGTPARMVAPKPQTGGIP
jgi:hypothetical protein